ncbi:SpoIIE family protein phosphatase [Streptomyces diastaticus]
MRSVVGQMFLLQMAVVVLLTIGAAVALVLEAQRESKREAGNRTLALAQGFADSPGLTQFLESPPNPASVLQKRAEQARKASGVDFVGVLDSEGVIYAHRAPDRIGRGVTMVDMSPILAGRTTRDEIVGALGPQVRAVVPVRALDGSVMGAVVVAITIEQIAERVTGELPLVLGASFGAVVITMAGAALISRRLLRQTHGLGPGAITRLYEHHDAVLHSVREGVVILDESGRLLLANDEARRLLGLTAEAEGRLLPELNLPPTIRELLASGREATDEVHRTRNRLLAVNQRPTERSGKAAGSVLTLRDATELHALLETVEAARRRFDVLYGASLSIGTTLEVRRTAEELAEAMVPGFADLATVDLADRVLDGEEPTGREGEWRRVAARDTRSQRMLDSTGELVTFASSTPQSRSLDTGRAVLASDLRVSTGRGAQRLDHAQHLLDEGLHSLITVPLIARGVVFGVASFWRSDAFEEEDDLALAKEVTARAAVCIDNARRYVREHNMAATLQRSLLPHDVPEQNAVEAAYRYLPTHAGAGGDWFDVIPLSGARVALVVGDVGGHGLYAAATMGRLRTAVHNFSTLDLPPDELLAYLDELVDRIDVPDAADEALGSISGVACLYAVYDPATGDCVAARAGHPPPVAVDVGGTVWFPDVPASPPLGSGSGLPFEVGEFCLAEGSRLVLYTDGLLRNRHRVLNAGLDLLRTTLSEAPSLTPEETCQKLLDCLLMEDTDDDATLLVARTMRLDPAHVAEWDLPADPAAVAPVRRQCIRQLEEWGLEEISSATELILSELITNAVRYGTEPIRVRMLYDRDLICEVRDGSSTAPHLRRAATMDEGGRGLLLVARFAERWGARYFARGKVIWAEQALHNRNAQLVSDTPEALLDQWDE